MQWHATFAIPFGPGNFSAAQTTAAGDLDAFGTQTQGRLHGTLHCTAKRDTALKLVSDRGGEALANTQWSVLTPGGDIIKESIGAFPRVVLSEGEYRAIAKNEGKVFEQNFKVVNGVDREIEVIAK